MPIFKLLFLQAVHRQLLTDMTQGCSNAIELSAVFIVGSNLNCTGAVILGQLKQCSNCSSQRIASQAMTWTRVNSRPDIRVEVSHESGAVCRPTYRGKKHVCSILGRCDRTSSSTYQLQTDTKCGIDRNRNRVSGQCEDGRQDMLKHCSALS